MKKPLIGVVPLVDFEKECYWMLPNYMKGIEISGGVPRNAALDRGQGCYKTACKYL